jgi:hypothetical protein
LNGKRKKELERIEVRYQNMLESIHGAAEEALGNQRRRKNSKQAWTNELDQLMKEKMTLYLKRLNLKSEEDERNYIRKKKEIRETVDAEKKKK